MIRRRIVPTRFGQVHVRHREGEGRPLLLLHMSPLSGFMYEEVMARLSRPVAAPDRLGFGASDPMPRVLTMEEHATVVVDVLDSLGWDEPVDVLGTHTGSTEAVALAHLVPGRVRKVVLVSVPYYSEEERAARLSGRGSPRPEPAEDGSHLLYRWSQRLKYRRPPYDLEYLHRLTVEELQSPNPHLAYRAVFEFPMGERLAALPVPVVVFAPADDLTVQTERARELLPDGGVFVDVPHLGLDSWHTDTADMAALLEEHLA